MARPCRQSRSHARQMSVGTLIKRRSPSPLAKRGIGWQLLVDLRDAASSLTGAASLSRSKLPVSVQFCSVQPDKPEHERSGRAASLHRSSGGHGP